jgi:hypothetical protein
MTSSIIKAYNSFDWSGWGESSKNLIAFVTAVFKASGSTVGDGVSVGEGDGDKVGVGDVEGEGEGAGAVCRKIVTTKRLHSAIITQAATSAFLTAFLSPFN